MHPGHARRFSARKGKRKEVRTMREIKQYCDKCNKEIGIEKGDQLTVNISIGWEYSKRVDLCRECAKPVEKAISDLSEQIAKTSL
jgi:hypothetical protein